MKSSKQKIEERIFKELRRVGKGKIIQDVGTPQRFSKDIALYKNRLRQNYYFALGYSPLPIHGDNNCDVNGDIHALPFKSSSADVIICFEVFEHINNPFLAERELSRVLKKNGTLILTVPFLLPYHGKSEKTVDSSHENYPDFWRFTHQGLKKLFENWSDVDVYPYTNTVEYYVYRFLQTVKIPLYKNQLFQQVLSCLQKPKEGVATHRHLMIGKK